MEPLGNSGSQNPEILQILLLLTSSQKKTNMKWTCKGHTDEPPGRLQFSYTFFGFKASGHSSQITSIVAKLHKLYFA